MPSYIEISLRRQKEMYADREDHYNREDSPKHASDTAAVSRETFDFSLPGEFSVTTGARWPPSAY